MHLFFLIPLTSALISGYIFRKSPDEMAYLTGLVTIISIVLTIALAPWQIQSAILAFVMIATKNLLRQNEYKLTQIESNQAQLDYSNVSNAANVFENNVNEGEKVGMYRGSPWTSNQIGIPSSQKANFSLKYRGASINRQKDDTLQDNG